MAIVKMMYPIAEIGGQTINAEFRTFNGITTMTRRMPSRKTKHGKKKDPSHPACKAFLKADLMYQGFVEATKMIWRNAIKKPHTSAYDLWMKECLT